MPLRLNQHTKRNPCKMPELNIPKTSLYIHIPFCRKKCIYCDFYSVEYHEDLANSYVDILARQIGRTKSGISTIFIGGGTPTVLSEDLLEKLLRSLRRHCEKCEEFTIEANPESINKEKLSLFLKYGINRISIGAQSFDDDKLKKLGRLHSAEQSRQAVILARESGFKNISVDLIYGVWGDRIDLWQRELELAVKLPITHLSCYFLTYEKNTPLSRLVENKIVEPLDEQIAADMYKFAVDYLPRYGFNQYEISNFAKEGYSCRHNCNYWRNDSYLGLGPSAVSYADGIRKRNISSVEDYIKNIKIDKEPIVFREELPALEMAKETLALKIRTRAGVNCAWFREKTGFNALDIESEVLPKLERDGLIEFKTQEDKITDFFLTDKGFLFCDIVSSSFL